MGCLKCVVVLVRLTSRATCILVVLLIAWFGVDFAYQAFDLGEGSGDPGGLPHRWIIKAVIPLSFFMMALAGVAVVIRSLKVLKQGDNS